MIKRTQRSSSPGRGGGVSRCHGGNTRRTKGFSVSTANVQSSSVIFCEVMMARWQQHIQAAGYGGGEVCRRRPWAGAGSPDGARERRATSEEARDSRTKRIQWNGDSFGPTLLVGCLGSKERESAGKREASSAVGFAARKIQQSSPQCAIEEVRARLAIQM